MSFEEKVSTYIKKNCPMSADRKQLVALSGGADSVAMLLVLKQLGYSLVAAHCNFHLRGEESDRDEIFCRDLCERHGIQLFVRQFDTKAYAANHHISIEMAARDLRYEWFHQLRVDVDAEYICVAHHREDNTETILLHLVRGTGIKGLTGIAPHRRKVVRPILSCARKDIENYLSSCGVNYVDDSTNFDTDCQRNELRINIIPNLRSINPSLDETMLRTARYMSQADSLLDEVLEAASQRIMIDGVIDVAALEKESSPELLLFHILHPLAFTSAQIEDVADKMHIVDVLEWHSSTHQLLLSRGKLIIEVLPEVFSPLTIEKEGTFSLCEQTHLSVKIVERTTDFLISKDGQIATIDAERLVFPLMVRTYQEGDRFIPFGMSGSRLVSDYLTDRKLTLFEKRRQLVVTDKDGTILWLVGQRTDNRFRITPNTRKVLILSIS